MKKPIILLTAIAWIFLFSFAVQASNLNKIGNRDTDIVIQSRLIEDKARPSREFKESKEAKELKDNKEESAFSSKELLQYINEWENGKSEEVANTEQVGSLVLTEGIGKKKTKLFAGSRKLLGKATKDDEITVVLFRVEETKGDAKETVVMQENKYTIGASRLFSAEVELNHIGVNYLLLQVTTGENKVEHQLYQIVVEDTKTKDKLESMTLRFLQ